MDRCELCGKEIQEGIQYITSVRKIHLGGKPWCATPAGHYSFCSECRQDLEQIINAMKDGRR